VETDALRGLVSSGWPSYTGAQEDFDVFEDRGGRKSRRSRESRDTVLSVAERILSMSVQNSEPEGAGSDGRRLSTTSRLAPKWAYD
jgi:hypothetical protein